MSKRSLFTVGMDFGLMAVGIFKNGGGLDIIVNCKHYRAITNFLDNLHGTHLANVTLETLDK